MRSDPVCRWFDIMKRLYWRAAVEVSPCVEACWTELKEQSDKVAQECLLSTRQLKTKLGARPIAFTLDPYAPSVGFDRQFAESEPKPA